MAPYLKTALLDNEIEGLQRSKDIAEAYGILAGEIETLDKQKSGNVSDAMVFKPSTLGSFMGKVKQGLPETTKVAALPLTNVKYHQFQDSNPDMYEKQLVSSAGVGSSLSRVIYSSDRMSNAELQYAAEAQYQIMKPLYSQFANFLEYWANRLTKKYHFKFIFDGSSYEYERDKRLDRLMKISDKGLVLNASAYASAIGMAPQDFEASLSEGKYGDLADKLSLLLNTNTTAQTGEAGRNELDDDMISESGERSRNQ